jgi:hypothetical protein
MNLLSRVSVEIYDNELVGSSIMVDVAGTYYKCARLRTATGLSGKRGFNRQIVGIYFRYA